MGTAQKKYEESQSYVDELSPGTELLHGQYTIKKFLNAGGFGITYLAKNSLERDVVIKECFPSAFCHRSRSIVQVRSRAHEAELKSVVDLFVQEARSLSKLDHPNIVGVHQVFEDNDTAYMVLDFVEGRDLLDVLEDPNHGLTAEQIKGILRDVLGAVQFIHDQDILHRDISPDNILIDEDMRPVLIDFGAAREEATKQSRVLSALRVVKDGYSPQEFYVQGSEQSPSSDLYALGATFYHLIMGETPPNSQARLAAIAAGDEDPYEALVDRVKGFDRRFLKAIDKALGILPKDRVQSAQEWLDIMDGRRNKSRVVTQQLPKSSAAAATMAAERRSSKVVPLMGTVAVAALAAFGALIATGTIQMPGSTAPEAAVPQVTAAAPAATPAQDAPVASVELAPSVVSSDASEDAVATSAVPEDTAADAVVAADAAAKEDEVVAYNTFDRSELPVASYDPVEAPAEPFQPLVSETAPVVMDAITAVEGMPDPVPETIAPDFAALVAPVEVPAASQPLAEVSLDDFVLAPEVLVPPTPLQDVGAVQTTWQFKVPFSANDGGRVITDVNIIAPAWAVPGAEVMAVHDQAIRTLSEIEGHVLSSAVPNEDGYVSVDVTVLSPGSNTAQTRVWKIGFAQETQLDNGMRFISRHDGADWVTQVAAIGGADTDLQVGDTLVGFVPTSETITTRTAIADILNREIEAGTEQYSFAVARQGSIWVASLNYVDPASVPTQ